MAEVVAAIGLGASVIAIIETTKQVLKHCKFYLQNAQDAPTDLRTIFVESSALKTTLESLQFITAYDRRFSATVGGLAGKDGPIEGCRRSMSELEQLLHIESTQKARKSQSKRRTIQVTVAALAWPLKQNRARKLLDEIQRYKQTIALTLVAETAQDIKQVDTKVTNVQDLLTDSQRHETCRWLEQTDPSPLHEKAQKDYELGTGTWMLQTPEWRDWLEGKQRCLLLHGIPGAGKTVLMSYLFEQVEKQCGTQVDGKNACVYYYCYHGRNQNETMPFLRWVLGQLYRRSDQTSSSVQNMFARGCEPRIDKILDALEDVLSHFNSAYVFIDAVDESEGWVNLIAALRSLSTDPRFKKIRLFASSREYPEIQRPLQDFAAGVSMDHPSIEDDIRLLVHSSLRKNPRFERWPEELLGEVEVALSTGAKGMFRWAVCQIDLLQRLKCDRRVIRETLASLPETLFDTYDRIMSMITEDERMFVQHVLSWIQYHSELYGEGISPHTLLEAVEKSIAKDTGSQVIRFYDFSILQDVCGCLIRIMPDSNTPWDISRFITVSSAHYTVREYLQSRHLLNSSAAFLDPFKSNKQNTLMEVTFLEALQVNSDKRGKFEIHPYCANPVMDALKDFSVYCMVSAAMLVHEKKPQIIQHKPFHDLAIALFNPGNPHYKYFRMTIATIVSAAGLFSKLNLVLRDRFWDLSPMSSSNVDAVHLFNLLILETNYITTDYETLGEIYLKQHSTKDLFQSRIVFPKGVWGRFIDDWHFANGHKDFQFDGSIVEAFAQIPTIYEDKSFKLLLQYGAETFDPSKILILFIGRHEHDSNDQCANFCAVERLLELGADPNVSGYQISPLQIAVASYDIEGVRILLSAGADPNWTGDSDGAQWKDISIMGRFNCLQKQSPLSICMKRGSFNERLAIEEIRDNGEGIKRLLLDYGGRDFCSP